jgi:ribose-phosphate pyrophosphokinase
VTLAVCALPGNGAFAARLGTDSLGLEYRRFPDGESYLRFTAPCAGREVALVCTLNDPDTKVLALLFAARTARELGATRVGLVAPYLSYMRQDHRFKDGEAITSTHFAALISGAFDWLVTVDPHLHRHRSLADVYRIPAHAVSAAPALAAWIRANVAEPLVVGPDSESEQWAAEVAAAAGAPHVVLAKTRRGDRDVAIEAPSLERWRARNAVLVDDIISSAHTMATAARVLARQGLQAPVCVGVHAVFAASALDTLRAAGVSRVVTTNTIRHETNAIDVSDLVAVALDQAGVRPRG